MLLGTGTCTIDRVAQHLGIDRRTIHRRLANEGETFSDLVEAVRRELARALRQGSASVACGGFVAAWFLGAERVLPLVPSAVQGEAVGAARARRAEMNYDCRMRTPLLLALFTTPVVAQIVSPLRAACRADCPLQPIHPQHPVRPEGGGGPAAATATDLRGVDHRLRTSRGTAEDTARATLRERAQRAGRGGSHGNACDGHHALHVHGVDLEQHRKLVCTTHGMSTMMGRFGNSPFAEMHGAAHAAADRDRRARRCRRGRTGCVAQLRRPARRVDDFADRRPRHFAAAGQVRRRRRRAAVHQHARPAADPYYRGHRPPQGLVAFLHPPRRRAGAIRACAPARMACRRLVVARPAACNDFSVGIELEGTDDLPYAPPQYAMLARARAGAVPALSRSGTWSATATSRRAARPTPAPRSTGRGWAGCWAPRRPTAGAD